MSQAEVTIQNIIEAVKKWVEFIKQEYEAHGDDQESIIESTQHQHAAILQFFDHCVESFPELIFKDVHAFQSSLDQPSPIICTNINNLAVLWFLRVFLVIRKYFPLDRIKIDDFTSSLYRILKKYFLVFLKNYFKTLQTWLLLLYSILDDLVSSISTERSIIQCGSRVVDLKARCYYNLTIALENSATPNEKPTCDENFVESPYEIIVENIYDRLALMEAIVVQLMIAVELEQLNVEIFDKNDNLDYFTNLLYRCFCYGSFYSKFQIMKFISLYLHTFNETSPFFVDLSMKISVLFVEKLVYCLIEDETKPVCCEMIFDEVCDYTESIICGLCTYFSIYNLSCSFNHAIDPSMDTLIEGINGIFNLFCANTQGSTFNLKRLDRIIGVYLNTSNLILTVYGSKINRFSNNNRFLILATSISMEMMSNSERTFESQPVNASFESSNIESFDVTNTLTVSNYCLELHSNCYRNVIDIENRPFINFSSLSKHITKLSEYLVIHCTNNDRMLSLSRQMLIVYWLNVVIAYRIVDETDCSSYSSVITNLLRYVSKFDSPYAIECVVRNILFLGHSLELTVLGEIATVLLDCLFTRPCTITDTSLLLVFKFIAIVATQHPEIVTNQFIDQNVTTKILTLELGMFLRFMNVYMEIICFYSEYSTNAIPIITPKSFYEIIEQIDSSTICKLHSFGGCCCVYSVEKSDAIFQSFTCLIDYIHTTLTTNNQAISEHYLLPMQLCYLSCMTLLSGHFQCEHISTLDLHLFEYLNGVDWSLSNFSDSFVCDSQSLLHGVVSWLLCVINNPNSDYIRVSFLIDYICQGKLGPKLNPIECVYFLHLLIVGLDDCGSLRSLNAHNDSPTRNKFNTEILEEHIVMWLVKFAVIHPDKSCLGSIAHTVQSMVSSDHNDYNSSFDVYTNNSLKINVMAVKFLIENRVLFDFDPLEHQHSSSSNIANDISTLSDLLKKIVYVLNRLFNPYNKYSVYSIFINETISILIHMANDEAYHLLSVISDYCSCNMNEMLCKSAKYIYSYLFLHCNGEELEHCSNFIKRCTKNTYELDSLARHDMHNVIIHLVMYLCVDQTTIMMAIAIILNIEPSHDNSNLAIKDYFSARLYGVIAFFNNLLSHGNYMELRLSIKSFAYLVELLGECHITKVLHKLLALIKSTTLKFKHMPQLGWHTCQLWKSFVQILSVDTCVSILPHISSGLIQLYSYYPDAVYEVYQVIVFDKFSADPHHCFSLIAIPYNDAPLSTTTTILESSILNNKFSKFNVIVEQMVHTWKQLCESNTIAKSTEKQAVTTLQEGGDMNKVAYQNVLERLSMAVSSDDFELQSIALLDTTDYIRYNYSTFIANLTNGYNNHLLADIIAKVVVCAQNKHSKISVESCKFFATMGTVDPVMLEGMLQTSMVQLKKDYQISPAGDDLTFSFELLKELCKSFVCCVDSRQQDCASYAIQEVLKFYECSEDSKNVLKYQRWILFDEDTRQILRPHLYSRYRTKMTLKHVANLKLPVVNSDRVTSCDEWITLWTSYLVSLLPPNSTSSVSDEFNHCGDISFKRISIIRSCITIVSQDHVIARTLLPHILFQVLSFGCNHTKQPMFGKQADGEKSFEENNKKCVLEFKTVLQSFLSLYCNNKNESPTGDFSDTLFGCMQVLFDCVDFLYERLRHFQIVDAPSNSSANSSLLVISRLQDFLKNFSWIDLCKASIHCKSYVRALRYIERDLSSTAIDQMDFYPNSTLTTQHADLLHQIYTCLGDVDNICGVSALKFCANNMMSRISELELKRYFHDAVVYEEVALCYDADDETNSCSNSNSYAIDTVSLECRILKNYLNLYQPRTVINYQTPTGWLRKLKSSSSVNYSNNSCINYFTEFFDIKLEAVWRLASWDSIDNIVSDSQLVFSNDLIGLSNTNDGVIPDENRFLSISNNLSFVSCIQSLKQCNFENFSYHLDRCYSVEAQKLKILNTEGDWFNRNYNIFLRLHILFDIEHLFLQQSPTNNLKIGSNVLTVSEIIHSNESNVRTVHNSNSCINNVALDCATTEVCNDELMKLLNQRLAITHKSYQFREPILALQRLFLTRNEDIAKNYLDCARIARKSKMLDTCNTYLKHSQHFDNSLQLAYERTKYFEACGDHYEAVSVLENYLKNNSEKINFPQPNSQLHSKVSLKLCSLSEKTSHLTPQDILKNYTNVVKLNCHYEKLYFSIANYYEKLIASTVDDEKYINYLASGAVSIINHYGTSLKYGSKYLHLSLPRLIILWMDFEAMVADSNKQQNQLNRGRKSLDHSSNESSLLLLNSSSGDNSINFDECRVNSKVNELCAKITHLYKTLPSHIFLHSLSQLISRICHHNKTVWNVLLNLLSFLLARYPQHTVWYLVGVANSDVKMRSARCREVFDMTVKSHPQHSKFITDVIGLSEKLIHICDKKTDKSKLNITRDFAQLKKMISQPKFSAIAVPILCNLSVSNVSSGDLSRFVVGNSDGSGSSNDQLSPTIGSNDNNFSFLTISSIQEQIVVLPSLQRPKKITIVANNGLLYPMMCKPKDDLRRDFRLMEFNALVNKFLVENEESHRRRLEIKLYAVVPLNDESGLIEWVEGTSCLRSVICDIYKRKLNHMKPNEVRKLFEETNKDPERLLYLFTRTLLKNHPPVLSEWFHDTYQDHALWYMARENFAKSCAVMSIVGFVLGLGDRHGENILLQLNNGAVMHVDFNCLFNKGELFAWPERVPFRLTHNMLNAMGVLGYEGAFRSCCVIVLGLMRAHKDSLITVLKTFLYDPLVEWTKSNRSIQKSKKNFEPNEDAKRILDQIDKRLLGFSNQSKFQIPLNVSGQVNQLIGEATDPKNLSQMFYGWAAFH